MKDYMVVADTIQKQLQGCTVTDAKGTHKGFIAMISWGAKNFVGHEANDEGAGALCFQVKGRKFKGAVKIRLLWNDTYKIEFWRTRRPAIKMVHSTKDVYFYDLAQIIDNYVEGAAA